ncbi:MAG: SLC13 family permease [Thiotrichales bacterium]|nr:SLC13 family permease [Thiotrichales bacterium]
MTTWLVLGSIALLLAVLITGRVQAFKAFLGLVFLYYLTGLLSLDSMLGNFVNPALITLIVLLMVSQVLEKTRWVNWVGQKLFSKGLRTSIARMGLFVGGGSAMLNNTAVVATLMSSAGKSSQHPPSKLLIPLSYIAIFGGTLTLIGTSTHLIINGFVVKAGLPELGMFDFIYVGGILLGAGTLLLVLLAPKILPLINRKSTQTTEYFIEAKLSPDSPLIGQTVQEANLRHLEELFLVQVVSTEGVFAPVAPSYRFTPNDRLMFVGDIKAAPKLLLIPGLTLPGAQVKEENNHFIEVVISHTSTLLGSTVKAANFRNKFDAAVVAIRRGHETLDCRLSEVVLKAGDTLVLITGSDFEKRENLEKNFYFYSKVDIGKHLTDQQSLFVGIGFLSVIGLAALEWLPLIKGLFILLALFLVFKLTSFQELRRRLPFELFFIIGSALGIASVMLDSGAANVLAESVLWVFSAWGIWGSFIGIYLLTVLLTELITNNAAAALGFPIALATSQMLDVNAWPFIMAVAYGASASFLTPYGYQTNLMVYTPGGYRFTDYIKMGLPVTIVYGAIVLTFVPMFFPF